jgi:hypothetical protein
VEVGVEAVKGVVPLPGPVLQILPPTSKTRGEGVRKGTNAKGSGGRNCEVRRNPTNLEDAPRRIVVDPQRLIQRLVERSAVVTKLLP